MNDCSKNKNPLINNGTSQPQRLLPAMDKSRFALVDEKKYPDWIVFANNFSTFINYYGNSNTVEGNWQPFFSSDISAQLGTIALQDIDRYRVEIQERFDFIRSDENKLAIGTIRIKLNELFSALLTLGKALDHYAVMLEDETKLKQSIQNLIITKLAPALNRLLAYYKGAKVHLYLDDSSLADWIIMNEPLTNAAQIIDTDGLSELWFDKTLFSDWTAYKNAVASDESIFNNPMTAFADDFLSIEHAANHNLFTGIFDTFLTGYSKIINEAEKELTGTLENYDAHTPHYALFLSFLKLYRFTQKNINTITQRHLDFYYKEVLRLQPRKAEANKVHVLAALAKQVDEYLLAEETGLKAGKDSLKKDVTYALENDTVFNKAAVAQLKTFYKGEGNDTIYIPGTATIKQNNTGRVFASPVSNSEDGLGAKLTSANKEWQPYVHKVYKDAELESIAMPRAQMGFALASHYLFLTEGERKVFIRLVLNKNNALDGKKIAGYLTTEKGWYQVDLNPVVSSGKKLTEGSINCTEISFTIPGSAPAIVNYNAAVHGGTFNTNLPLLKIYLQNADNALYEYDVLKDITISKAEIKVEVGFSGSYSQNGLKNLQLSGDFGGLDASKPFMPFGTTPTAGNRLVIGNKELFSKKNASLQINLEWKDLPGNRSKVSFKSLSGEGNYPDIAVRMLSSGTWQTVQTSNEIFENTRRRSVKAKRQISLAGINLDNTVVAADSDYQPYGIGSNKGFIALQLKESFGHKEYLKTFTDYLVRKANNIPGDDIDNPAEPYTPLLQSIFIGYSAYRNIALDSTSASVFKNREIQFFHIYPFGEAEQHKYLNPGEDVYLLPQFKHAAQGVTKHHNGEFYIGLEKLNPESSVNLLFQVMEGTTNPTVVKPEDHINWSYLSKNRWIAFQDSAYSDNTLQLVQSGIISFAIPADAGLDNTVLPAGYIWLRASVSDGAEAVCKLLSVNTQAAVAGFLNNDNAPDFLDDALPAGTISKLKIPDASVKKLEQPYPSFGGRPRENEDHFYIRVSERLRHKDRGIMVWDYEHLVLEAFPEIYKVKCLNHTQVEEGIYNEVKPGYVSIITIPSLLFRNDTDPLKPYTQQSTLTKIENFLRKRISCFVKLRACQPQFEEVRLEFSLKLYDAYKDFTLYAGMLKEEITRFLSPWAYDDKSTVDFGGKVYKSVLINFIEERYYVDFITDVKMYVKPNDTTPESSDMDEISASTARSILVSVSASKHTVHKIVAALPGTEEECSGTIVNTATEM